MTLRTVTLGYCRATRRCSTFARSEARAVMKYESTLFALCCAVASLRLSAQTDSVRPHDGQRDFDFAIGTWKGQPRGVRRERASTIRSPTSGTTLGRRSPTV